MKDKRGLLYPALHKFYNALSSLDKFDKGTNFFDNISYLDSFFSEYRNITFVLQNSVAHTQFKAIYEELRDKYLLGDACRWFIGKRNEVVKQQPFDLEKGILINIYSEQETIVLPEKKFTIDNDVGYSTIIESLKKMFFDIQQVEVMFSAEFKFYERGHHEDLYDNIMSGINQMKLFMAAMRTALNEDCKLSDELAKRIERLKFYKGPKNFLFIDDYIFYCKRNVFEKSDRIELLIDSGHPRVSSENFKKTYPGDDLFQKFQLLHLIIFQMQKTLLPTCLLYFNDETIQLLSFGGSIKTTIYRKFHEVAKRIKTEGIISVLFVTEMYVFEENDVHGMDSRERIKHARKESLSFYILDKNLMMKRRSYDTSRIDDFEYVGSVMFKNSDNFTLPSFYSPVIQEFSKMRQDPVL